MPRYDGEVGPRPGRSRGDQPRARAHTTERVRADGTVRKQVHRSQPRPEAIRAVPNVRVHVRRPGFASVCEAFGGFRHINGFADRPPVRPNISMGDTLAGLHAALGATLALLARERSRRAAGGAGGAAGGAGSGLEVVDVAIYEAVCSPINGPIMSR